ncbi:NAD-dependent epimerase/dehydratase family protein [Rhodococcus sp. ACT016]|uniref:NAD-dependent epimerase/dehydratase family protein n=1 Tax=Rhodococcus sp. ACT016 TaxID=3134808 RepID=UPI003D2A826F
MRVLVTGATGFVGTNLVRLLDTQGVDIVATGAPGSETRYIDACTSDIRLGDLNDVRFVRELVEDVDWVFHIAGDTSTWKRFAPRRQAVNVTAVRTLAGAALEAGVKRFIHTSTIDVHGYNDNGSSVPEHAAEHLFTGMGYDYAETKTAGELEAMKHLGQGLDVVVVYPGFMIGPFDHTLQLGRVIVDMKQGKRTFAPPGTGSFCDVRNVAKGMLAAAEKGRTGNGYNLSGHNLSYSSVFKMIADIVGAEHDPITIPAPVLEAYGQVAERISMFTGKVPDMDPGMARYMSAPQASDWSKANDELGYTPGNLSAAIQSAAQWYDENVL